ncbi:LacI family transcriptional regulator [Agromyces sp. SYSU K20354]|uniref:LacI family DNA-binding transcriptional regulator n=1 Tax=Agromyces cavernae TaxID=2898659 RepID=UPI001E582FC7|nr:LacI family DNA-binding transcriptional regulator [Agromyces cavernae]MCD2442009.1 LacI family transcriptional regulator [Agromyces cavernae]
MARSGGVTIRDVARRAGVSIAAVSMALNGTGTLSVATRARVRAVADEMEYQADSLARGLRSSSVGAIGLVIRSLDLLGDYAPEGVDVFTRFIGATTSQAMARGLSVMLVPDLTKRPTPPLALGLDGYIVDLPHVDDPVVRLLERRGIPYVTVGRDPDRPDFTDWASEDGAAATRRALDHFAHRGAGSVALVRGAGRNAWNIDAELTYREWCAERGIAPYVDEADERDGEAGGRLAAERLLAAKAGRLPDAVFCFTGRHAAGLLAGLTAAGLRVPADVMIAVASDSEHARHSRPAITAFELSTQATSAALLDLLQARMDGRPSTGPILTSARFHPRGSTKRRA